MSDTTFWVIERINEATSSSYLEPKYWAAGQTDPLRSSAWTSNFFAAIGFARKQDAEAVIRRMMLGVAAIATEHMIMDEHTPDPRKEEV